jgi:hypothetical protein
LRFFDVPSTVTNREAAIVRTGEDDMRTIRAGVAVLAVFAAARAEAFPAFARKYGMSCAACHEAWPIVNQQGQNFRDNGYQFNLGKDDPVTLSPDYWPMAIRITPAYQWTRTTNQTATDTATGTTHPVTTQVGGVPIPPGVDFLSGGVIAKNLSFLVVVSGFGPDGAGGLESAWARFDNLGGTGWFNAKIGKFELDLPASPHRGVSLLYGYAAYGAHPGGSMVGFDLGENQVGIELDGHDARSTTRWALSFTSANEGEGLSRNAWSDPMIYGHVQRVIELANPVLPWIRVGALGAVGWWPTVFATDDTGAPIPGTGTNHKSLYRAGAEVSWYLGYPATPAFFTAAYIYGREEAGLAGVDPNTNQDLSTAANQFHSGFIEVDWVPSTVAAYVATPFLVFARWDVVRFKKGSGDTDGGTVGVRRYIALGPRAAAAIHLEGHVDRVKHIGWTPDAAVQRGRNVTTQSVLAGIDFDF